ncbi:hypothetical protein [Virgibacillus senegalensis]|uniref:hypothetical protein n=1 Tax=Virgibacillus senegalensis TaxID=1499679 RepID=UPI00069DBDE8|nr:hypothetical protein [Virgibacillus senegalensis]
MMSEQWLNEWKQRLEERKDLLYLYERKQLDVNVEGEGVFAWVVIRSGKIRLQAERPDSDVVPLLVKANKDIAVKLFNGERKLTALPAKLASWEGKYRDCLLFETLLYLP